VRIEDDVLVTEDGYENLTTTPKGDEALKIINGDGEDVEIKKPLKRGWFW
jgi:Xaa-Pro dipeptidase